MDKEYRLSWRNGAVVKTDLNGNIIGDSIEHERAQHYRFPENTTSFPSIDTNEPHTSSMAEGSAQQPVPTGVVFPSIDEHAVSEKLSPEQPILTKEELAKRDRVAVAYSKDLLLEGDTLVYISYPGDSKCFDSTGFEVSAGPYRVHSGRLLATGSKVFAELLGPKYQYRIVRRKKMVNNMPLGIKYIIDLTPPDEGDEAVELTSELSCSIGIRMWYTAAQRCGIPNSIVGGEDEIIDATNITSFGSPPVADSTNVTVDIESSSTNPIIVTNFSKVPSDLLDTARDLREFAQTVRMSVEKTRKAKSKNPEGKACVTVPDYCPIRHRAGIARLLRVLEGKDPRLDSAPKVWTLFALANHFDCTSVVVDWIVSWMICHPNSQFIEILPEVSCKIAFGLRNQLICRAAFSILVSEEALSLASREVGHTEADSRGTNQFGRLRDDVDEDLRTRIEYASKNFASRICMTYEALAKPQAPWVMQLGEYQKITKFKQAIRNYAGENDKVSRWLAAIERLERILNEHLHSRILSSLSAPLTPDFSISANNHRLAEKYMDDGGPVETDMTFLHLYNKLTDKERIYTRFFWQSLNSIEYPVTFHSVTHDPPIDTYPRSSVSLLLASQKLVNDSILEAIEMGIFNNGMIPLEAIPYHREIDNSYSQIPPDEKSRVEAKANIRGSEGKHPTVSWDPFLPYTTGPRQQEAPEKTASEWNTSMTGEKWNEKWVEPKKKVSWSDRVASNMLEDSQTLMPNDITGSSTFAVGTKCTGESTNWDTMDIDEYLAQHHLLNHSSSSENATRSDQGFGANKSNLALRLKDNGLALKAQEVEGPVSYTEKRVASQAAEFQPGGATQSRTWMPEDKTFNSQAGDINRSPWIAESFLARLLSDSHVHRTFMKRCPIPNSTLKPPPKPIVPTDSRISAWSTFFSLSQFFLNAKDHIRSVANSMLDRREMGFDVALTDTLLCLGPEEFKYLPLWAGGDDDDSGGVFDDAIPIAVAGPNGPGPSYHTGFSTASAASSEFDAMSDRTAINTSIAVEDGYSDHIDRRLVLADDDFLSETFSEDSEVYDRKGKGVERNGFYTSAPASESAFSVADTMSDFVPEGAPAEDFNFDMEYFEEDSDADTTTGNVDTEEGDEESWDSGDAEYFDFGDKDEEMVNI